MSMMRNLLMMQEPELWLNANRTDSAEMAASDAAAIAVFKKAGLCKHDDYMTVAEAKRVTQLPKFYNVTALIDWDWSALTNLNCKTLFQVFFGCTNLSFTYLPDNIIDTSYDVDLRQTFYNCKKLKLKHLPNGFGVKTKQLSGIFYGCTSLELEDLPEGFGSNAIYFGINHVNGVFINCKNLKITQLPSGIASKTSDLTTSFAGSSISINTLPYDFGKVATSAYQTFYSCKNITELTIGDGLFPRVKDMTLFLASSGITKIYGVTKDSFPSCTNFGQFIEVTPIDNFNSLPKSVGDATFITRFMYNCSKMTGSVKLNNEHFGKNVTGLGFLWVFYGSKISEFTDGAFDFSGIPEDTGVNTGLCNAFTNTLVNARFVSNTLKYSTNMTTARLEGLNTESLCSFAECLYDFGSYQENKKWHVTSAQKTILNTEMYDDTRTYTQYVEDKGWTIL